MDHSETQHLPAIDASAPEDFARLRELLEAPATRDRTPMFLGIAAAAVLFALAVAGALRGWLDGLIYGLALAAFAALILGMRGATAAANRREKAALAALAGFPLWTLARATVASEFSEGSRVQIVNFLNRSHPGWSADLDSADPAWRELKNAQGGAGGCGGCGSRCG